MEGTRKIAQRGLGADEAFLTEVTARGFTRREATIILNVYRKHRAITTDHVNGTTTVKHGAFWDEDVLRRALGEGA